MDSWIEAENQMRESGARAVVAWRVEDIQTLVPQMSDEEALAWLEANEDNIADRMVERGWAAIEDLLSFDGIEITGDPDDVLEG